MRSNLPTFSRCLMSTLLLVNASLLERLPLTMFSTQCPTSLVILTWKLKGTHRNENECLPVTIPLSRLLSLRSILWTPLNFEESKVAQVPVRYHLPSPRPILWTSSNYEESKNAQVLRASRDFSGRGFSFENNKTKFLNCLM